MTCYSLEVKTSTSSFSQVRARSKMAAQTPPPASNRVFSQFLASTSHSVHRFLCSPYPIQQHPPQDSVLQAPGGRKNGHRGSIIGISGSSLDPSRCFGMNFSSVLSYK